MNQVIGKNLKSLRNSHKFSQEQVAQFLGLERSTYGNYETGQREAPLEILEKVSHLYGCDLHVLFEENEEAFQEMLICTFRVDGLSNFDLQEIAEFKEIVKSYLKMDRMLA
jgi:transcriptional regulator with XRE-family HTH domain